MWTCCYRRDVHSGQEKPLGSSSKCSKSTNDAPTATINVKHHARVAMYTYMEMSGQLHAPSSSHLVDKATGTRKLQTDFSLLPLPQKRSTNTAERNYKTTKQVRSEGLSVSRRKHIAAPLRAQQLKAILRFVTTVY
jgi:hypothetical protein